MSSKRCILRGVFLIACFLPSVGYAQDVGGIIGGLMGAAIQAQQQQQFRDQQRREREAQQRSVALEQKRRDAEFRAQQKADEDRRSAEVRSQQDRAQALRRSEDDARKRKDALSSIIPAAKTLIEDASSFVKANPASAKLLDFITQISSLNSAVAEADPAKIQDLMRDLSADLRQEPSYALLEQNRVKQQKAEADRYLPELVSVAKQEQSFIRFYITNNPTSRQATTFIPLVKEIDASLLSPELSQLRALTSRIEVLIREAGLASEFARSKNLLSDMSQPQGDANKEQPQLLRKSPKNAFLFDGSPQDFVLLYNSSPKAPHITKNISGEFDFDGSAASACLYQPEFDKSQTTLLRQKLMGSGVKEADVDASECPRSSLANYDIIAVERGQFMKLRDEITIVLYGEIQNDRFRHFLTVTSAQRQQLAEADLKNRAEVLARIQGDTKEGYGVVFIGSQAQTLCLVVNDSEKAHRDILLQDRERLNSEFGFKDISTKPILNDAYKALQRQECQGIYGRVDDLRKIAAALKAEGLAYSVSSLWKLDADVEVANRKLQEARDALAKRTAEDEANRKAEQALQKNVNEANAATKTKREADLRSQFGKIAAASAAAIANDIKAVADDRTDWQASAAFAEFPKYVTWYRNMVGRSWELQSFNSDVFDYGRAKWKDRIMETSFTKVSLRMRNRILGEYKDECYIFGRMNDAEFNMIRDTAISQCDQVGQIDVWKRARDFQSQWVVR